MVNEITQNKENEKPTEDASQGEWSFDPQL